MHILIDLLHPAHIHFFSVFYRKMITRGHQISFASRKKDCAILLLEELKIPHTVLSRQPGGQVLLPIELILRTGRLLKLIKELKPDVLTGIMGPCIALASRLCGVPAVVFYDSEGAYHTNWFAYRLAHTIITPQSYLNKVPGRQLTYPGCQKLAYLHPNHFQPDPKILSAYGRNPSVPYVVLRFVSWQASHDLGRSGLTLEQKREILHAAAKIGQPLISAEGPLPEDLEPYRVKGPSCAFHHLLGHSRLVVGESLTVAAEAALLGVSNILFSSFKYGYTEELEKRYQLVQRFAPEEFTSGLAAIHQFDWAKTQAQAKINHQRMIAESCDLTQWMIDFFEHFNSDEANNSNSLL